MVELSDRQMKQLKTAVKKKRNRSEKVKILDGNDLPHVLLLTTRQKTKLRHAFNNSRSTDLKHS